MNKLIITIVVIFFVGLYAESFGATDAALIERRSIILKTTVIDNSMSYKMVRTIAANCILSGLTYQTLTKKPIPHPMNDKIANELATSCIHEMLKASKANNNTGLIDNYNILSKHIEIASFLRFTAATCFGYGYGYVLKSGSLVLPDAEWPPAIDWCIIEGGKKWLSSPPARRR